MAFSGSLAELAIPEILQLLSMQQKSGVLTLQHPAGHQHVLFLEHGKLLAGADRRQAGRHAFLAFLHQNLILENEQAETVEDLCRETGHDIFTVLLTSGMMSKERLLETMQRHAQRVVDELVHWKSGTYEFTGDRENLPSLGLRCHLNPEELVLESMRRTDELAMLQESLLGPELVLVPLDDAPHQPVPRECQIILKLVDGERNIEQICRLSPLGEYLSYDAISELLGRQLAMIVDPQDAQVMARQKGGRTRRVSGATLFAALSLLAGSVLLGAGIEPLLSRTAPPRAFPSAECAAHRAQVRTVLAQDVQALGATISR